MQSESLVNSRRSKSNYLNSSKMQPEMINKSRFSPADSYNNSRFINISRRESKSSWITDDASSILESELLAARVSNKLFESYHTDRLFKQLIFKSFIDIYPDPKTPEVSYASLRIAHQLKKKRKRNRSKHSDAATNPLDDTPPHIMNQIIRLQGKRNSFVEDNFSDPVVQEGEKVKEEERRNRSNTRKLTTIKMQKQMNVRKTSERNNVLHFFLTSKKIEDVNKYIRYRAPDSDSNKYSTKNSGNYDK